ncbi:MAG: DNA polymerase III subunit beta, partial [Pseudomonadota bacterium]
MKVSIERAALLRAMSRAQGVVERRNTIPILANVALESADGQMRLRTTDLDIELIETLPASVAEPGSTTVAASMLFEIVRKLPDGAEVALTLEPEPGRLDIRAGRSKFALATLPLSDFPEMATNTYDISFQAPASEVSRLFEKARFAVSTEETRYYLNGVYMHVAESPEGRRLRAV